MNSSEKWAQYNRLLELVRFEVEQVYKLFYFFFVIESTLIGAIFIQQIPSNFAALASIVGIGMAFFAKDIVNKQKQCRDYWIDKMKIIEKDPHLSFTPEYILWKENRSTNIWDSMNSIFVAYILAFLVIFFISFGFYHHVVSVDIHDRGIFNLK